MNARGVSYHLTCAYVYAMACVGHAAWLVCQVAAAAATLESDTAATAAATVRRQCAAVLGVYVCVNVGV